jgi:hypothetical protein
MCIEFFNYDNVVSLASIIGPIKTNIRESKHSFTDYVMEVYFSDDVHWIALCIAREIELKTGQFICIRIQSEREAYLSIPVDPATLPF